MLSSPICKNFNPVYGKRIIIHTEGIREIIQHTKKDPKLGSNNLENKIIVFIYFWIFNNKSITSSRIIVSNEE